MLSEYVVQIVVNMIHKILIKSTFCMNNLLFCFSVFVVSSGIKKEVSEQFQILLFYCLKSAYKHL